MARRKSRKPAALVLHKKSRRARRRNPGYGMALSRAGSMKLAGIPVLPVAGFGLSATASTTARTSATP